MPLPPSLLSCTDFQQYYCSIKLSQALLSSILIVLCIIQIVISVRIQGRITIDTRMAIVILMVLSLIFNFIHTLASIKIILFLQLFFANNFFLTIFYYVADNVLKGYKSRIALHIFYILMIIFFITILILRSVYDLYINRKCQQQWYMAVDAVTICISIMILILYCKKNRQQIKMQKFYSQKLINNPYSSTATSAVTNYNSPFIRMWILISTNIFCGVVNLIHTVVLYVWFRQTCKFSTDMNLNTLINFIFKFFDYYIGSIVTLIVLRKIRLIAMENDQNICVRNNSDSIDIVEGAAGVGGNKLEMCAQLSSRSSNY